MRIVSKVVDDGLMLNFDADSGYPPRSLFGTEQCLFKRTIKKLIKLSAKNTESVVMPFDTRLVGLMVNLFQSV